MIITNLTKVPEITILSMYSGVPLKRQSNSRYTPTAQSKESMLVLFVSMPWLPNLQVLFPLFFFFNGGASISEISSNVRVFQYFP